MRAWGLPRQHPVSRRVRWRHRASRRLRKRHPALGIVRRRHPVPRRVRQRHPVSKGSVGTASAIEESSAKLSAPGSTKMNHRGNHKGRTPVQG